MLKAIILFVAAFAVAGLAPASSSAQTPPRPPALSLGDAAVTGFSGTIAGDPRRARPAGKSVVDVTFINPDGASARVLNISRPGFIWDGRFFPAPKTFDVFARDVGQVFGVALDDQTAPNIYLAATSSFGLNLVARGRDGLPERRRTGGPGVGWMKGQFGLDLQGDPGSVYKVDGSTGAVSVFAKVMLDGVPNPGPALGNLAYDAAHKQLFVSDRYTGMIHRFATVDGGEPGAPYDHGVTGRAAAGLPPAPFNPAMRPNIASSRFDSGNPATWGYAAPERHVWALAVHDGRLFYSANNGSTVDGPQIWSVGIQPDGGLAADARLEIDIPAQPGPYPVSDLAFSAAGAMIVAQRAPIVATYDYSAFVSPGEPRVLRFWLKDANDPPSPGLWKPTPEEYPVGFAGSSRNSDGGVTLGYGYDHDGMMEIGNCGGSLLITGDKLRLNPALRDRLAPGGPMPVDGVQIGPVDAVVHPEAALPWTDYFVDYDDKFDDASGTGRVGGVRTLLAPCPQQTAAGYPAGGRAGGPPYISGPQTGGGGGGGGSGNDGCVGDQCNRPKACFASAGQLVCDHATGKWAYKLNVTGPGWINSVSAVSLTPPVSASGGNFPLNPASIPVTGPPGSTGTLEICAFDAAAAASGRPYDCCRAKVRVTIPNQICGVVK